MSDPRPDPRRCDVCGDLVPAGRRRALPGVTTCVRCSGVERRTDVAPDGADPDEVKKAANEGSAPWN